MSIELLNCFEFQYTTFCCGVAISCRDAQKSYERTLHSASVHLHHTTSHIATVALHELVCVVP